MVEPAMIFLRHRMAGYMPEYISIVVTSQKAVVVGWPPPHWFSLFPENIVVVLPPVGVCFREQVVYGQLDFEVVQPRVTSVQTTLDGPLQGVCPVNDFLLQPH